MVTYSADEMMWECRRELFCECGVYSIQGIRSDKYMLSGALRYESVLEDVENIQEVLRTYDAAIFPAISGLARKFYWKGMGQYFAGIWEDDLALGLLWEVDFPQSELKRPMKYRAPSWS